VLAVIRGGAAHIGVKGRLDLVRSTDGGKTWSPPWTAIDGSLDDRNPAIGLLKDGAAVLAYAVAGNYDETGPHFKGGRTDRLFDGVYLTYSRDNGRTWSRPVRDPVIHKFYDGKGLVSPYGKIVQLPDGTAHLCAAGLAQRSAADPVSRWISSFPRARLLVLSHFGIHRLDQGLDVAVTEGERL